MTPGDVVDVAIVGAGPAGTTLAAALARRGVDVLVLERSPAWHWRAGGVFASPAAVAALRRAGSSEATVRAVTQPIPAMRLETPAGTTVRLTYGADAGRPMAVGFDRSALDPALERLAIESGASIERGSTVHAVRLGRSSGSGTRHLLDLGLPPGPRIGEVLKQVYEKQLDGEITSVEEGLEEAKRILTE